MNWQFTHHNILREIESGYEIHLDGGTWFHPKRLRPVVPTNTSFPDQITLLRKGLKHIKLIGEDKNQQIEHSLTTSLLAAS